MSALGSATKKVGQAIPGVGGGDSQESQGGSGQQEEQIGNLAAGVVGKTGDIVDDTGKTVGKITDGEPGDLVGNVVTATGEIVGKDGGIVGKALPLGDDGEEQKEGGFSLMGAAKGLKGVVDLADGTVQTVNRSVPLVGDITKGLGLGGDKPAEGGSGLLGGLLGSKPEDRDPTEKENVTEQAKKDLFEVTDKTQEVAPIDLKDVDDDAQAQTEVESKSQPPQNAQIDDDATDGKLPEGTTAEELAKGDLDGAEAAKDKADGVADDAKDLPEDAQSKAEGAADEAKDVPEDAQSKAEGAADEAKEVPEDAQSKVDGVADDAKDLPEDAQSKAEGAADDAASKVPEDADEAKDLPEDAQSKAEDVKDEAEGVADDAGSKVANSELDDMKTVTIQGDMVPNPFEKFEGAEIDDEGKVMFEEGSIGKVVEGNPEDLAGKDISPEGAVLNSEGSEIGRVELKSEIADDLEAEAKQLADLAILKDCKVNKGGNVVNDKNEAVGRIVEGILGQLVGRKCDAEGKIWNDAGAIIGRAEIIPENEREEFKEGGPFEDFPDAIIQANGDVTNEGEKIGVLVEGDAKKLRNKSPDADGDVLDKNGNKIGFCERWEPEEEEPEAEVDNSALAGKRVNKAGYVVDSNGNIFGRVVEGDIKRLQGRMCNKKGEIVSESGDVLGKAELVPEGEREGFKEGPFADLPNCTVAKDGTVVTPSGDIVGRLTSGDGKVLFGRAVDEDGDVLDKNGNSIGKAERWEPEPEPEKPKGPLFGRKVNKKGEVYDDDHNLIGKLTSGELSICSGKTIDEDDDVVDGKGNTIGHVSLLEDIPDEPEPEGETEEEKKAREQAEEDEKLAKSLGGCIEQGLERVRPICKMITDKIEAAERKPKDELDEEELVKQVKPLIEEGGKILSELNGTIRALDPDGRIQKNAKHKSGTREATSAEYHLADVLKELTGTVTTCIDNAKKKIEDMPHAKKELNPLWGLLTEPLGQILAAVGLLLTGVLNLVGRLLNGLGLGGLVDGLLGTLGLNRLLDGLGLGSLTGALTGKKDKKK